MLVVTPLEGKVLLSVAACTPNEAHGFLGESVTHRASISKASVFVLTRHCYQHLVSVNDVVNVTCGSVQYPLEFTGLSWLEAQNIKFPLPFPFLLSSFFSDLFLLRSPTHPVL